MERDRDCREKWNLVTTTWIQYDYEKKSGRPPNRWKL